VTGKIILIVIYAGVLLIWLSRHPRLTRAFRNVARLGKDSPQDIPDPAPLVSVLIPALNEENSIARCVEAMLAQTYPNVEIVVANDRSTDRTAEIVEKIAERDPRVRLIQITELPAGWTGKCNALWQATKHANGEFLLFIDADTVQEPENLAVCMHRMIHEKVDMLSLLPAMRNETFWEHAVQPLAGICLMVWYPTDEVNDPDKAVAFANGQYILIRRSTYDAVGGHEGVKDRFLEDVNLARQVKGAGNRLLVATATEISSTRMYTSPAEMINGWGRIYYGAADRRLVRLLRGMLMLLVFSVSAYVALPASAIALALGCTGWFTWTIFGMAVAHLCLKFSVMARLYRAGGNRLIYLSAYWLACIIVHIAQWSALSKVFTGRVTWRGTAYGKG